MSLQESQEGVGSPESLACRKVMAIWSEGNVFHTLKRWRGIDRLSEILERGLIPPLLDPEGRVTSDFRLEVKGASRPYNSVVFLHRFAQISYLYIPKSPDLVCIFIAREFPVQTVDQMGKNWPKLSQDEVYSTEIIPPDEFIGLAVSNQIIESVFQEFQDDLHRLSIPLYDFAGNVYWPR